MRKTKLAAVVLVAAGLLFGASGTALAVGGESKPETSPATTRPTTGDEDPAAPQESPATKVRDEDPATTAKPVPSDQVQEAIPARPVPGDPSFTG